MKINKLRFGIVLVLVIAFVGYFFIKPQDYRIVFRVNTFPGAINQTLKLWHSNHQNSKSIQQISIVELKQQFDFNDSIHQYRWQIESIHDSLSQVTVDVKDPSNSFFNRFEGIFKQNSIANRSKSNTLDFIEKLNEHLKKFRVHSIEKVELPTTFYAYLTLTGEQNSKARGMMNNFGYLTSFLIKNQIEFNGSPFISVEEWDQQNDSIRYNFCFPIKRSDKLPTHPEIKYKKMFNHEALKIEYNGNYIYSDRAWYALLDYAEKNHIEIEPTPIESFFNNPNMGGNELNWKALIYMPLKKEPIEF